MEIIPLVGITHASGDISKSLHRSKRTCEHYEVVMSVPRPAALWMKTIHLLWW